MAAVLAMQCSSLVTAAAAPGSGRYNGQALVEGTQAAGYMVFVLCTPAFRLMDVVSRAKRNQDPEQLLQRDLLDELKGFPEVNKAHMSQTVHSVLLRRAVKA
jgi:hypothetical protein